MFQANEEIETLKKQLYNSEEIASGLLKELNQEKQKKTFAETNEFPSDDTKYGTKTATVGKKINTVRPVARLERNFPILENRTEKTSFRFEISTTEQGERTVNKVDVRQLEQQCRDLEEQLDQVKLQIVKIVTDKNVVCKENAFLRNYQIAFDSLTEQNEMLKKKLVENDYLFPESLKKRTN